VEVKKIKGVPRGGEQEERPPVRNRKEKNSTKLDTEWEKASRSHVLKARKGAISTVSRQGGRQAVSIRENYLDGGICCGVRPKARQLNAKWGQS